jgi:hypothetical protein
MKILKFIGIGLVGLIVLLLLIAAFVSKDFSYEKSVVINAPIDSVWINVNSLGAMDKWSPWNDYDPNMKKSMSGTDGTVGAVSSWESEVDNVGKGSQTITKIEAPTSIETQLKFLVPYESEAVGYVYLSPEGDGTKATWGFKSEMPYPMNLMKMFMDMQAMMDKDFGSGLNKLKALSEK